MDQEILNSYSRLNDLNVSRETFLDFENYISLILEKNKKINIISQNTASKNAIIERHIIAVSYTHLRAHETCADLVCRLLLEKKKCPYISLENYQSSHQSFRVEC